MYRPSRVITQASGHCRAFRSLFLLARVVPDRFDVVPIGIKNECGVVPRGVISIAWFSVIGAASGERGLVKGLNLLLTLGDECQVGGYNGVFLANPQIRILAVIETSRFAVFHVVLVAESGQNLLIEGFGFCVVPDLQRGVSDHGGRLL